MLRPGYLKRIGHKAFKRTRNRGWSAKYPKFSRYKNFNSKLVADVTSYYYSASNLFASLIESRLVLCCLSYVFFYQLY